MADAARHFAGRFEDEGVRPWRRRLEQPVLLVVDAGVVGQLAQVSAQQGEMVFLVDAADLAQPVDGILVVEVAGQRIAGVGRHGDDAAALEQRRCLLQQPGLRIVGMDFEILGHVL
jgi:hypothetical protein